MWPDSGFVKGRQHVGKEGWFEMWMNRSVSCRLGILVYSGWSLRTADGGGGVSLEGFGSVPGGVGGWHYTRMGPALY